MKWIDKALVGAVGGIALALLKLIDNHFFVSAGLTPEVYGNLLTYMAYVALGMIVAVFLTDPELPASKLSRNAFVLGLLAPSVLIAITAKPLGDPESRSESRKEGSIIQKLKINSNFFISSGFAQTTTRSPPTQSQASTQEAKDSGKAWTYDAWTTNWAHATSPPFVVVDEKDVTPSFADGVWSALGRPRPNKTYVYVLGETNDRSSAMEYALQVNKLLKYRVPLNEYPKISYATNFASILRPNGSKNYIITLGGATDKREAKRWKAHTEDVAKAVLAGKADDVDKKIAINLLDAKVIEGWLLFQGEASER